MMNPSTSSPVGSGAGGIVASILPPTTTGSPSSANMIQQNNMVNERQVVRIAGRQAICQFLESHNCFAVLRMSGKVVVFDVRIPIQLAFYALVEHGKETRYTSVHRF
jgi:hypothetical protein